MNNIIKILLLGSIFFVACQNKNTTKELKPEVGAYNNAVVELAHEHSAYLERLENSVKIIRADLKRTTDSLVFQEIKPIFSTPIFIKAKANPNKPPLALQPKDRAFFKNAITLLNKDFDLINEVYTSLTTYINKKEYKVDGGKKGNQLLDSLSKLSKQYSVKQASILKKITELNSSSQKVHVMETESIARRTTTSNKTKTQVQDSFINLPINIVLANGYSAKSTVVNNNFESKDSIIKTEKERRELVMLAEQEMKLREAFRSFAD